MKIIYTDGACSGNPGPGGWAWVSKDGRSYGKSEMTTNNIMELTAIMKAISDNEGDLEIRSDSLYAINVIQGIWNANMNIELINDIKKVVGQRNIIFTKVKGHSGDKMNDIADSLARF